MTAKDLGCVVGTDEAVEHDPTVPDTPGRARGGVTHTDLGWVPPAPVQIRKVVTPMPQFEFGMMQVHVAELDPWDMRVFCVFQGMDGYRLVHQGGSIGGLNVLGREGWDLSYMWTIADQAPNGGGELVDLLRKVEPTIHKVDMNGQVFLAKRELA